MKPVRDMTRLELAGFVAAECRRRNLNVVLSGGSCVSIYSRGKYVSIDLDFVNVAFAKRALIKATMEALGFPAENRYFRHPDSDILIEFPPGPLGIGEESVKEILEMETGLGILRIISPTDCVKDRLSWFYHGRDTECLEQAVLVAQDSEIDLKEVERWSKAEGKGDAFAQIKNRLRKRQASSSIRSAAEPHAGRCAKRNGFDAYPICGTLPLDQGDEP